MLAPLSSPFSALLQAANALLFTATCCCTYTHERQLLRLLDKELSCARHCRSSASRPAGARTRVLIMNDSLGDALEAHIEYKRAMQVSHRCIRLTGASFLHKLIALRRIAGQEVRSRRERTWMGREYTC